MSLVLESVVKSFGGVRAVDSVSLEVPPATIVGLIGPNGSGKTTLLSLVAGTIRPTAGTVTLSGRDLTALAPHHVVSRGVARTFQTTRVMPTWTVRESLELALRTGRHRGADLERVVDVTGIGAHLDRQPAALTNATQRVVMIAAAAATGPEVLLLDEPAVGMDPGEAERLHAVVGRCRADLGTSVIVVEHNMRFLMSLADTVVVMASGRVIARGTPEVVRNDPAVVTAYLGG